MTPEQHAKLVANPRILGLFRIGVRRRAISIPFEPHDDPPIPATQKYLDWSKRVLEYKDDKSSYYAGLVLEGLLETDSEFRGLVEQQLNTDELLANGILDIEPEQLISKVEGWVARFIRFGY